MLINKFFSPRSYNRHESANSDVGQSNRNFNGKFGNQKPRYNFFSGQDDNFIFNN